VRYILRINNAFRFITPRELHALHCSRSPSRRHFSEKKNSGGGGGGMAPVHAFGKKGKKEGKR